MTVHKAFLTNTFEQNKPFPKQAGTSGLRWLSNCLHLSIVQNEVSQKNKCHILMQIDFSNRLMQIEKWYRSI